MRLDKRFLVTPILAAFFAGNVQAHGLWTEQRIRSINPVFL